MPSAEESCCCGARVTLTASLWSLLTPELAKFREAHATCRDQWAEMVNDHEPDNPQGVWCCEEHRRRFVKSESTNHA